MSIGITQYVNRKLSITDNVNDRNLVIDVISNASDFVTPFTLFHPLYKMNALERNLLTAAGATDDIFECLARMDLKLLNGAEYNLITALIVEYGSLVVTTFTQSLGAELLVNGDFSAWTGDNPDGWTVGGESGSDPAVSQVAPSGGAGTGAARFYSSAALGTPTITQSVLTSGLYYEGIMTASNVANGIPRFFVGGAGNILSTSPGSLVIMARVTSTSFLISHTGTLPTDITIDSASAKRIALNTQETTTADATHTFEFTLPGSPVAGQEVHMVYRIPASDPFLNSWDAYLRRNTTNTAWDFRLDRISAGTRINSVNVTTGIGTPDAIRVVTAGNNHTCYTGVSGTFTARGMTVSNATHNASTGINTIYSSAVTPVRLESA